MKNYVIYIIAFVCLLAGQTFAQTVVPIQKIVTSQKTEKVSDCFKFPMPVLKPNFNDNAVVIIEPDTKTDQQMVFNPCETESPQLLNNSYEAQPKPGSNVNSLTTSMKLHNVTWSYFTTEHEPVLHGFQIFRNLK